MNNIDKQYQALLQDILDNGVKKQTRNGEVLSVFGRQIRHSMKDGFPLLTTKKLHWRSIVTELLWFLQGRTDLRWLLEQGNTIWVGDAYKYYCKNADEGTFSRKWLKLKESFDGFFTNEEYSLYTQEEFINKIKTDDEFAKEWGELGPIYGKQWRKWTKFEDESIEHNEWYKSSESIDQIANSINLLKTDPDSRRNRVNAWNVGELDQMVLPPCHTDFQFFTRELSLDEREVYWRNNMGMKNIQFMLYSLEGEGGLHKEYDKQNVPTRAISLMFNMRSTDVGLGLGFNLSSYGLLLMMIAKQVNMIPDELIYNGGDVHLYSNHIEPIKEQLNRKPYELPTLNIMKTDDFWKNFDVSLFNHLDVNDFVIENYKSHPPIKLILSN